MGKKKRKKKKTRAVPQDTFGQPVLGGNSPFDISTELQTAVEYHRQGLLPKAEAIYRKILSVQPDHADALNFIGYTYAEQGKNLDEAFDMIQKALKLKPGSGYIIDSLGWVYFQKGLYDEALTSLEKASTMIPDDPTVAEHLGDAYFMKKEYQKSLEMYLKALSLKQTDKKELEQKIRNVKRLLD